MDKLVAMEAFVRVVEAGSFTAAARSCGRSKARLSQSLAALESELGVVLLQRTTRSLRLTEAGEAYYRRCTELLGEIERVETSLRQGRQSIDGRLRVTAPPGFAARYLAVLTSAFHGAYPRLSIELDLTHHMLDLVESNVDVAIRVTEPRDSSLIARKLAPVKMVAVAAPSYLRVRGRPTRPEQLKEHDCLVDTNFREQQRWRFRGKKKGVTITVGGPFRVNSPEAVRELAIAGHGIALSPHFVVEDALTDRRLVEILKGKVDYSWSIYAVYARRSFLPARISAYVDHLARALG